MEIENRIHLPFAPADRGRRSSPPHGREGVGSTGGRKRKAGGFARGSIEARNFGEFGFLTTATAEDYEQRRCTARASQPTRCPVSRLGGRACDRVSPISTFCLRSGLIIFQTDLFVSENASDLCGQL
jgi:hypothetical protein